MKEMAYLLFKKKICPRCLGQMDRKKCHEVVDGKIFDSNDTPLYISACKHVNHYYYTYVCRDCRKEFALAELAESKRDRL
jgi:hypothetical protein